MKINIKQILIMWASKGYSKEERLKDLKSLGKFCIKNPEDYFKLLVYTELFKYYDTDSMVYFFKKISLVD